MARRPKPQKCVHCLKYTVDLNWDHVFPLSWYPDTTAANESKWKIPSCIPCNSAYGRLEKDFLERVGLCLDPSDPASRSIVDKVQRALDPTLARSDKERRARSARRREIIRDVLEGVDIPREATYPGLGERWDTPLEGQTAITIPVEYFQRMTEKIVRGLFFLEDGKLIEPPFNIEHFAVHDGNAQHIRETLARFGHTHSRPPGIVVRRAVIPDDGISSIFEIVFWQQFSAFATVLAELPDQIEEKSGTELSEP